VARMAVLAESVVSLRALPQPVYADVSWASFLPHWYRADTGYGHEQYLKNRTSPIHIYSASRKRAAET
jgi:hypothetical protein